jgi:hypothetical protein
LEASRKYAVALIKGRSGCAKANGTAALKKNKREARPKFDVR